MPASPGRSTASTRKGPGPSSRPARRLSAATNRSHASGRSGSRNLSARLSVTSFEDHADRRGVAEATAVELVAQPQQVHLPPRLAVDEAPRPAGLRHALDLDAPATAHRHVHVLPARAHADAHVGGRAAHPADEKDRLLRLLGCPQVGAGDGLDERHAQPVGPPHDEVAAIGDLAARVLLDRHLRDRELAAAERQPPVHADDGRALKAGGDRAVEILLPRDVHLVDDVAAEHQALLDRDVHRLLVHREGRRVVHLVRAGVLAVEEVDDVLAGLELHERGAVVDAELRERRPHVAQHGAVVRARVAAGRAVAEELALGEQLLVDLEPADEADGGVVERGVERVVAHDAPVVGAAGKVAAATTRLRPACLAA